MNGCATFRIPMFTFTKNAIRFLQDKLFLKTSMEEEGTGKFELFFKIIKSLLF